MKIIIKNMVCDRCIFVINNILQELSIKPIAVRMGEVELHVDHITPIQLEQFRQKIEVLGFEIINDKKSKLIENIKNNVISFVQNQCASEKLKLSEYLSKNLYHDYSYLSNLFSAVQGVTIEQYFINQKIEKTKELLVYDELSLTEIAYRLNYSSVAHLSRQFKKVTGLTPTQFKQIRDDNLRLPIDKV